MQFWIYGPFHLPPPTFSAISSLGKETAAAGARWPLNVILANLVPFLTWNKSLVAVVGVTVTALWSSPTIETKAGTSIGFASSYLPERTLIVVPDWAIPTAALIVSLALSIDVPLFVSTPSFAT